MDDAAALHRFLSDSIPDWDVTNVSGGQEIGEGWESVVTAFTVESSDGSTRPVVVRSYAGPRGGETAVRESAGMRALHAARYPVPRVFAAESGQELLGAPFLIMEWVDGEPLWPSLFTGTGANEELLDGFVELLVRLHRIDHRVVSDAPSSLSQEIGTWAAVVGGGPLRGFDAALAWLEERVADVAPVEPAVLHWDYHPENVLYDGDAMVVIDWTQVGAGDPRFDLAWTMLLVGTYEGCLWRDAIATRYQDAAGSVESLEFFAAAVSRKRLYAITVSLLAGPETLGMRKGAAVAMADQLEPLGSVYAVFQDRTGLSIREVDELLG